MLKSVVLLVVVCVVLAQQPPQPATQSPSAQPPAQSPSAQSSTQATAPLSSTAQPANAQSPAIAQSPATQRPAGPAATQTGQLSVPANATVQQVASLAQANLSGNCTPSGQPCNPSQPNSCCLAPTVICTPLGGNNICALNPQTIPQVQAFNNGIL